MASRSISTAIISNKIHYIRGHKVKLDRDLIVHVDKALYQAKRQGKNRAFIHG